MDGWVLNDELSSISPQSLIVTEEAADLQRLHSAPDSSYIISTLNLALTLSAYFTHYSAVLLCVSFFFLFFFLHISISTCSVFHPCYSAYTLCRQNGKNRKISCHSDGAFMHYSRWLVEASLMCCISSVGDIESHWIDHLTVCLYSQIWWKNAPLS